MQLSNRNLVCLPSYFCYYDHHSIINNYDVLIMIHPQYDPVALSLGPVEVHWYGLMYLLAFAAAFGLAWYRSGQRESWTTDMVSDLVFYGCLLYTSPSPRDS